MRVHLIRKETIESYLKENPQSSIPLREWLMKIRYADWRFPGDIKLTFPATDLLGNGTSTAVFDVGGNTYRMICKYAFGKREIHLFVCWIGTHSGYDKLCNSHEQYYISKY